MRTARQHGMSIIEVMIAITLAALLLALGAPSFFTGMQNRQIRTAASALQNGLQQARTEALRRNRNVSFRLTSAQGSWTIGCETEDATVVNGEQVCPAVVQTRDSNEGTNKAQVDKSEITSAGTSAGTTAFTDTGTLTFTPLGRVTTTAGTTPAPTLGAGDIAIYSISNPTAGTCVSAGGEMRCLSVRVTAAGQVRSCDPAVASGDPRAC